METLLAWSLLVSAVLHITEEFAWPGGFVRWYRAYRPQFSGSMTTPFFVTVNGLAVALCAIAAAFISSPYGVSLWLTLAALFAANGLFHLRGSVSTHAYSPGMITAVGLYVPIAIYGYVHYIATQRASMGTAIIALLMGASFQFWSNANHVRRSRAQVESSHNQPDVLK
jgi:hypothetical protein